MFRVLMLKEMESVIWVQILDKTVCISFYTNPFDKGLTPSLQLQVVIYKAFCLDLAQGHMNGTPNENWTHSWRFASLAC